MTSFFNSVTEFFELIWNFITNLVESLLTLLRLLLDYMTVFPFFSGLLPPIIAMCGIVVVAIALAKVILGR